MLKEIIQYLGRNNNALICSIT